MAFEAQKRYLAKVCYYPCCGLTFCACKPAKVVLSILKVTDKYVHLKSIPEMGIQPAQRKRAKRCVLNKEGKYFDIKLIDNGDQHRRMVNTRVYTWDLTSDDEDDHTPLSILAKRF